MQFIDYLAYKKQPVIEQQKEMQKQLQNKQVMRRKNDF